MLSLISAVAKLLVNVLLVILSILPGSPFTSFINELTISDEMNILGYLNYFVPFDFCLKVLNAWLLCVLAYFVYTFVLHSAKKNNKV